MNVVRTWNMIHPNEYMSLCVVGRTMSVSSSDATRSSGAIHRTVPLKAEVK